MSTNPTDAQTPADRGFDLKKRPPWPWIIVGAVLVITIVIFFVVRDSMSNPPTSTGEKFGTDLSVAYLGTDAAQQAFLEFVAEEIAPDYDITVEPVPIGDPNQLHQAVSEGEIAATVYAHTPWLEQSNAANDWTLESLVPVFQWAYSLWSSKYDSFEALPDGARIAILDDPANTAQALLLLANDGVIELDPGVDPAKATLDDIVDNPRDLEFQPIAFGSAARSIDDFDAIISYNFEFTAAGTPEEYKIYAPDAPRVFAAQLAVSRPYVEETNILRLVDAFSDPRVAEYLESTDDRAVKGQLTPVGDK